MAWVPDSREAGYLGPRPEPQGAYDDAWEDFLHDIFAGVTGLDPTLVRPRWQPEPPNIPDFGTDWMAFGITETKTDFEPWIGHNDAGDGGLGYDMLQEQQVDTVLCIFYGPHAAQYSSYLRRGLFVWQNRAALRANAAGLVEITSPIRNAEQIKAGMWLNRVDLNVVIRREIRFDYSVRTILRAQGLIEANPPGSERVLTEDFDTGDIPHPEEN